MKKNLRTLIFTLLFCIFSLDKAASAQDILYTVQQGDSLWKIAVKYEIGLSELKSKNPSIANPDLIYPGQKITVPNINDIKSKENEVIRLVNVERANRGLLL